MKKPNIVLITADQWRGDCLGGAGGRHPVMIPHLNQIAAEGVRFTNAYADCPVCMPQRVTTLPGADRCAMGKVMEEDGRWRPTRMTKVEPTNEWRSRCSILKGPTRRWQTRLSNAF